MRDAKLNCLKELFVHLSLCKPMTDIWIVSNALQCLEPFNFVDMLNWIVRNRTDWSFCDVATKCVYKSYI